MGIFFNNSNSRKEVNSTEPIAPAVKTQNNHNQSVSRSNKVSIIASQTTIKGTIETASMLQVEGTLEGNIISKDLVHISSSGKILGNIDAKTVFIDGEANGEILADKVEIGERGRVFANITSSVFVIREGGLFEGNKKVKKQEENKEEVKSNTSSTPKFDLKEIKDLNKSTENNA